MWAWMGEKVSVVIDSVLCSKIPISAEQKASEMAERGRWADAHNGHLPSEAWVKKWGGDTGGFLRIAVPRMAWALM